jgi:hypothetical protein
MNKADLKARIARSAAFAVGQVPMLIDKPSDMPGFSLWKVGEADVGMPTLLPTAPKSVKRRYLGRIIANAIGRCPSCSATIGDPTERTGQVPISRAQVEHEPGCGISDNGPSYDRWLDPAADRLRRALAT